LCGQIGLIPFFDMPSRLVEYAKNLIRSATTTMTPAFSTLEAKNDIEAIRRLFLTGCRYALYLSLPIQLALLLFGGSFLQLWLKDETYRVEGQPVLWILASMIGVAMLQSVAARVLYGMGQIRLFARLVILEALLNLGLSILLIRPMGISGVALGTALPNFVMCLVVLLQVCRMLEVSDRAFFRQALLKPLLAAALLLPAWLYSARFLPPDSWSHFVGLIAVGLLVFSVLVLVLEGAVQTLWFRARDYRHSARMAGLTSKHSGISTTFLR
jgi:O-antigen/teichoic acid export membrane protein